MGRVLLEGGFRQIQVHPCVSLSFPGAACQPGDRGMWIVCHLCQEPWIPGFAGRGCQEKALEGEE